MMQGKTVVITGASSGIGKETARALAAMGARVIMACRNRAKSEPVREAIERETGNQQIEVLDLDLASLESIRGFAAELSNRVQSLDVLINNAGVFSMSRKVTADGFERTMGVNYLGPFLLTNLLVPWMQTAPQARIVNISSVVYVWGRLNLHALHLPRRYFGVRAYASSKLALIFFTQELAGRLQRLGITANAVHPGFAVSELWTAEKGMVGIAHRVLEPFMVSAAEGARTPVLLASSDQLAGVSGRYFVKCQPRRVSSRCRNPRLQRDLWLRSEELVGLNEARPLR